MKFKVNQKLTEDTVEDVVKQAEKAAEQEVQGDIEKTLDRVLAKNKSIVNRGSKEFINVLLVGDAGSGKTARVKAWAAKNGVNLFPVKASVMDETDLSGPVTADRETGTVARRLASTEFDNLNRPNSVLFLDEYNRAPRSVRGTLLQLINEHELPDAREENNARFLPNMLFTIAAINPANGQYDTDSLDVAENSRFMIVEVGMDPKVLLSYLSKEYNNIISSTDDPEEKAEYTRKLRIATKLLKSTDFKFDNPTDVEKVATSGNGIPLNFRSFTRLIEYSDGTKDDVLDNWNRFCNNFKKPMAERILSDYKDVDDKANSVFDNESESPVFAQTDDWNKKLDNLRDLMDK